MLKQQRLRKPIEFRRAYNEGERFRGRFMTAFIVPSETSFHRIGVTASRKAIGNSVRRSRAKRLLREAFRLSSNELSVLERKYDWAINARGYILKVKADEVTTEFREIIEQVRAKEMNPPSPEDVN